MVQVRREQNRVLLRLCVGAAQDADDVPGLCARDVFKLREMLLNALGQRIRQRGLLKEAAIVSAWLKAKAFEERSDVRSGDMFIAGGAAAATQHVRGEKVFIGTHACVAEMGTFSQRGATKRDQQ